MIVTRLEVGPADHGRMLSLDEFAHAEGRAGHLYELARGRVVVVDVPGVTHALVVQAVQRMLYAYDLAHPGRICLVAAGSGCALRLPGMQSERHPDAAHDTAFRPRMPGRARGATTTRCPSASRRRSNEAIGQADRPERRWLHE